MAAIKFNHAFAVLMAGCAAAALFLPKEASDRLRTPLVLLFAPVSGPVTRGAGWLGERIKPHEFVRDPTSPRTFDELDSENHNLRVELVSLSAQLEGLKQLNTDRQMLGSVRERSVPARVVGLDAGTVRKMLQLIAPDGVTLAEGMPVITPRGYVGRLVGGFRGAARVRLTTDPESKVQGAFKRFTRRDDGGLVATRLDSPPPLVVGAGDLGMRVQNLSLRQIEQAGVQVGDWVVIEDQDFMPTYAHLQGFLVGRVSAINNSRINPLMAELVIDPPEDLRRVREVMVVVR